MLTAAQAKLYTEILFVNFVDNWMEIYKFHVEKIFSSSAVWYSIPSEILPRPETIKDLALIVLFTKSHQKRCLKILREILTKQQLFLLFKEIMAVANLSPDDEHHPRRILRGNTLHVKIFKYLVSPARKKIAKKIKGHCIRLVDNVYADITKNKVIPTDIPKDYKMSVECEAIVVTLFKQIDEVVFSKIKSSRTINALLSALSYYAFDAGVAQEEVSELIYGYVGNRVIGPIFDASILKPQFAREESSTSSQICENTVADDPKEQLQLFILNRYLPKIFSHIMSTSDKEKADSFSYLPEQLKNLIHGTKQKYQSLLATVKPSITKELAKKQDMPKQSERTEVRDVPRPVLHLLLLMAFKEECVALDRIKNRLPLEINQSISAIQGFNSMPLLRGLHSQKHWLTVEKQFVPVAQFKQLTEIEKQLLAISDQYQTIINNMWSQLFSEISLDLARGVEQIKIQISILDKLGVSEDAPEIMSIIKRINLLQRQFINLVKENDPVATPIVLTAIASRGNSPARSSDSLNKSQGKGDNHSPKSGLKNFMREHSMLGISDFFDITTAVGRSGSKNKAVGKNGSRGLLPLEDDNKDQKEKNSIVAKLN